MLSTQQRLLAFLLPRPCSLSQMPPSPRRRVRIKWALGATHSSGPALGEERSQVAGDTLGAREVSARPWRLAEVEVGRAQGRARGRGGPG